MALQAAVERLTKEKKKRNSSGTKTNEKDRSTKKQKTKGKNQNPPKPKWMSQRPTDEDLHKPQRWNGSEWWYCHPDTGGKCNGVYRRHKPSQCEGRAFKGRFGKAKEAADREEDTPTQDTGKKLKVAEALTTIVNGDSDENSSDGYES